MTQEELDKLPEAEPGKALMIKKDEDFIVVDTFNQTWLIGYSQGVKYKAKHDGCF